MTDKILKRLLDKLVKAEESGDRQQYMEAHQEYARFLETHMPNPERLYRLWDKLKEIGDTGKGLASPEFEQALKELQKLLHRRKLIFPSPQADGLPGDPTTEPPFPKPPNGEV